MLILIKKIDPSNLKFAIDEYFVLVPSKPTVAMCWARPIWPICISTPTLPNLWRFKIVHDTFYKLDVLKLSITAMLNNIWQVKSKNHENHISIHLHCFVTLIDVILVLIWSSNRVNKQQILNNPTIYHAQPNHRRNLNFRFNMQADIL